VSNILSLHFSHDGCATYVRDNKIIFHTQLDRYNRYKHSPLPSKKITDILLNLEFDKLLITQIPERSTDEWFGLWSNSYAWLNKLKKVKIINFELKEHHLFHAFCALTWKKNIENILICDGRGIIKNNILESESIYKFKNNNLYHNLTENNNIGHKYQLISENFFKMGYQEGKLLALSLHDPLAKKTQNELEQNMLSFIKNNDLKKDIIFTGGVAQNVKFNSLLLDCFDNVFCDPFNGDFGISLGSANYVLENKLTIKNTYLGIPQKLNLENFYNYKIVNTSYEEVSKILLDEPVAIFQSRSEQGQRGLGNRSLLMSPLHQEAQEKLNNIKKREWYRPFACSILQEEVKNWFNMKNKEESPYMMYLFKLLDNKINILKSGIAIDNTSRIQTVKKTDNEHFYNLLKSFNKLTNIPILINTSLNLPGEVLVETLDDLLYFINNSKLKYIYLPEIQKVIIKNVH
jgi:predicted NodU family carbamoyl transferase